MAPERMHRRVSLCLLLAFSLLLIGFVSESDAWWNEQWQYRKKISLNTTATGVELGENLTDVPVLLRLHSGNFDFTRAKENGDDLRFVDGSDQVLLKHHIEAFDSLDELALIWVKLPRLSGGSTQDHIWLYYGNDDAAVGEDAEGTHDTGLVGVYHFDEIEGNPQDASAYANHAVEFSGGQGLPGVIGSGMIFNGVDDRIVVGDSPSLNFTAGFTFSAWIRISQPQQDAVLFMRGDSEAGRILVGIDGNTAYAQVGPVGGALLTTDRVTEIPLEEWHHLAVTAAAGGDLVIYLDGRETTRMAVPGSLPEAAGSMILGSSDREDRFFAGDLDEVKISNLARSPGWISVAYGSQGPQSNLASAGIEEVIETGGLPVFYLATVLKNVTLDGWVIIGLLILLSLISWIIMLSKAFFLFMVGRDNKKFANAYNGGDAFDAIDENGESFSNSTLYRVYTAGRRRIQDLIGSPESEAAKSALTESDIQSLTTELEKGFVEESKRLNAWLVVLTMSITGGPFLGLLGTVWGVMNTFAAMAEAGEANIMAIAPGVASALSTTVFGLIVAIPALFGYNFLAGKIKGILADLNVFVDEFALKMRHAHGGRT